jgi:flagellar basal body-associated protein FliL
VDESPTPEDYRRAGLQAARRRALLMIVMLTLLAAAIIAAAAWLISGYEPPSTAAETHGGQVPGSTVALGTRA